MHCVKTNAAVSLYIQFLKIQRKCSSGPSCSKLGLDNLGLVRDLNSDLKA